MPIIFSHSGTGALSDEQTIGICTCVSEGWGEGQATRLRQASGSEGSQVFFHVDMSDCTCKCASANAVLQHVAQL